MIGLVFCHGWALGDFVFKPTIEALQMLAPNLELPFEVVNLNLYNSNPESNQGIPFESAERWIAIGHSWGFNQLIESFLQASQLSRLDGLVAVNAFTRYCRNEADQSGWDPRSVHILNRKLRASPHQTVREFHQLCGLSNSSDRVIAELDLEKLRRDLVRIEKSNSNPILKGRMQQIPMIAMACRRDQIVPCELTLDCFGHRGELFWLDQSSHLIPWHAPEWCAQQIFRFVQSLANPTIDA